MGMGFLTPGRQFMLQTTTQMIKITIADNTLFQNSSAIGNPAISRDSLTVATILSVSLLEFPNKSQQTF